MKLCFVRYFNSIKVRLERVLELKREAVLYTFQFHKGTIRTSWMLNKQGMRNAFQFHKGTIRTPLRNREKSKHHQFQFHKGTIRTLVLLLTARRFKYISIP